MNITEQREMIDGFENHYNYDTTYMRELLESSQDGFTKFNNFLPMASHQEKLGTEDYWVAKLAAMQIEDCGDCLQLNVKMALEGGLSKAIVKSVLHDIHALPDELKDVYEYARQVASNMTTDLDLLERISSRYNKGELLEFGLCIASAKVFPTIKRALGYTKSCQLVNIDV